ncbi:hypothetical protein A936_13354 [Enterobacter sp. Ag1]|nr:hypothetical protein A936_13354 [Enterobacter sp. Ag1]
MKIENYQETDFAGVQRLLTSVFGKDHAVALTQELALRLVIHHPQHSDVIIGHAALYMREMSCQEQRFLAGIIGDVAVAPEFQRQGLAASMLKELHQCLKDKKSDYSFLFAYQEGVYKSSGYRQLTLPIRYFDVVDNRWNTYFYNGGMIRATSKVALEGIIDFNGRQGLLMKPGMPVNGRRRDRL